MHRRRSLIFVILFFCLIVAGELRSEEVDPASDFAIGPSPTNIAFRSLLIPGWGQATNGKPLKAVIYGGIEQGLIYGVYRNHVLYQQLNRREDKSEAAIYKDQRNRLTWYLAASLIISAMDAFVDAHLLTFDVSEDLSKNGNGNISGKVTPKLKLSIPIR